MAATNVQAFPGDVTITDGLAVSKDIESTNSFITERVLFKETWPNGHNSLAGDLGTWVITNLSQQSNPSSTTTPDGYTHVSFNGQDPAQTNGEFVSPAFDLSNYAIVDGTLQADDKRKTTTRVFMKFWLGSKQFDASNEVVQVQFSPDNGSTWYTVATSQDRTNTDRFTMVSADLSPYILETSTNAKIRFYLPWTVGAGDYVKIGRIWIHESDVPTNLGGMWLGAAGKIGIGTTAPKTLLDVKGTILGSVVSYGANQDAAYLVAGSNDYTGADTNWGTHGFQHRIASDSSGTPRIYVDAPNGGEVFTIQTGGNVGIGTSNPAAELDLVLGTSNGNDGPVLRLGTGGIEGSFTGGIAFSEGVTSESRTGLHMGIYYDGVANKMHFTDSNASSSLVASLEAADKLVTIERTTGHVGIGTTNPADELVVAGTIRVDNGSQYPLIMDPGHALVYNAQRYFPNISANSDNYLGRFSSNGSPAEFNITDTGSALGSGSLYNMAKMYGTTATNPPVVTGLNSSIFTSYGFYWQTTSTTTYDVWFRPTRAGYYTVRVRAQGYSLPTEPSSPTLVAVNYGSVVDTYGSPGLTINKSRRYNNNSQLEVSGNVVVKQHMTFCSGGDETSTINLIPNNVPTTCSYLSFVRSGYFQTNAVDTSAGSSGLLFATNSSNDIFTWGMYQHYVKPSAGFTTAVGIEIGRVDTIADESSTSYKDSSPTFTHLFNLQATGNFGAGTRDPLTRFHAYNSYANSGSAMIGEGPHHNNTNASEILDAMVSPSLIMPTPAPSNADDVVIAWKGSLASKYKVTIDGVPYFTGQHGGVPINYDLKSNVSNYTGLIVCPTDTGYKSYNHTTGLTHVGQRAIEINECLPYIKLSETAYDKSVFGVLSNAPNNSPCDEYGDLEVDDDPNKKFGNTLRDRVRINSLGEGAIWVTDLNGNLENGDYITSSNISGYGMKQDSEFLANYTVGKITMSCDFNPNTITVKQHKKVFKTNKYWIKYTSYEEVAYKVYEDTPDDQRIMDTLQEFLNTEIEEPPISLAEYNSLEPEVQAKYTPESRVRYRTRGVDRRKYEEPPPESMRSDFEVITVDEYVDDLDANGISILEDVPSGETELEYKIRYLDSVGAITDEAGASCKAAFVGCTYHCG